MDERSEVNNEKRKKRRGECVLLATLEILRDEENYTIDKGLNIADLLVTLNAPKILPLLGGAEDWDAVGSPGPAPALYLRAEGKGSTPEGSCGRTADSKAAI